MDRRAIVCVVLLAVVLAGCQGVDREVTPSPGGDTPTAEPTVTPGPAPAPGGTQPGTQFAWRVGQVVGTNLTGTSVGELVIVTAHPAENVPLAVEDAVILLQHDGQTRRFVHESVTTGDAAGTFSVDPAGFHAPAHSQRFGTTRALALSLASTGTERADIDLDAGETATLLVTTPSVTTEAVTARVPETVADEVSSILYGRFAEADDRNESTVAGKPQVVSATGTSLTDDGAGVVNLTVTKLPGTNPVDYRQARLRLVGPDGTHVLTHTDDDTPTADGHFGLTPLRDEDRSAPTLTDGDRFRLTLDLGADDVTVDDGPAGTSIGTPLGASFDTRVVIETARRQRHLRLALPKNAVTGAVALRGVVPRGEPFPRTNQRPSVELLSGDSQRTEDGRAISGLSINVRKPPTADPLDPRTLTVGLATPTGNYTLVHHSRGGDDADGHFGVTHRFNPDGSAPLLDDFFDLSRLTVDLGEDTRDGDDGPLDTSVGQNVTAGQVVTVTVQTADGIAVPVQYYVTERNNERGESETADSD
ncbi:MAG: hypothetical protein V5A45_05180 [Haloarculaceae archaeon]